jgi:phosphoenolpyruvate synthase/pyruvate phosphate dikinase
VSHAPVPLLEASDPGRFGAKAANLSALVRAGLPVPPGWCLGAEVYRAQLAFAGLDATARKVFSSDDGARARRCALDVKLGLMEGALAPEVAGAIAATWRAVATTGRPAAVRSSALVEDREGASFAGQFQSYLGIDSEEDFAVSVRACWAALWATRALRYMGGHGIDAADTAMAVLVQPLIAAGGGGGGGGGGGFLKIDATTN